MITQGILSLASYIIAGFNALLPSLSVPTWFTTGSFTTGVVSAVGGWLSLPRPVFPVDAMLTILAAVLSLWPVVILFLAAQWAWEHVPTIAGFGTH